MYISGKVNDINILVRQINSDLQRISDFSTDNCLKLNEGKSVYIIIGSYQNLDTLKNINFQDIKINDKKIKREKKVRNLGVIFDENLSWKAEIAKTISNGHGKLTQSYRHKNFLNKKSKVTVSQSYILSQFNYNSIILQNLTQQQITKIQKFKTLV